MKTIVCLNVALLTLFAATPGVHAQRQRRPVPVVTVQVSNAAASEGVDEPAVVVVHRNCGIQKPLRVFYSLGGACKNGADYQRISGSVVIPAGSLEAAVEIRPIDDDLVEGTERVAFCLKPPPKNAPQYRLGAANRRVIEIADNDETPAEEPPVEEPPADENTIAPATMRFHYLPAGYGTIVGRSIRVPPLNYVYHAPATVNLVANTDYIVSVEFFVSANFLGAENNSLGVVTRAEPGARVVANTFSFVWSKVPAGSYTLTAKGIATDGREIFDGPLTLTVQP